MLQTVIGVVVPVQWTPDNRIDSISIQATDEEEDQVAGGGHLRELMSLCGTRVRVLGVVERRGRATLIHVVLVERLLPERSP